MIRALDPQDHGVGFEESHDHRKHLCDLPSKTEYLRLVAAGEFHSTTCTYVWLYRGRGLCGCPMCTDKFERRAERRRVRHEGRRKLRALTPSTVQ